MMANLRYKLIQVKWDCVCVCVCCYLGELSLYWTDQVYLCSFVDSEAPQSTKVSLRPHPPPAGRAAERPCSRAERPRENVLRSLRQERRSTSHIISLKETLGSAASLCFQVLKLFFFVGGISRGASISPSSHGGRAKAAPWQQTKECLHDFGTTDLLSVKESRKRTPGLKLTAVLSPSLPVGPV